MTPKPFTPQTPTLAMLDESAQEWAARLRGFMPAGQADALASILEGSMIPLSLPTVASWAAGCQFYPSDQQLTMRAVAEVCSSEVRTALDPITGGLLLFVPINNSLMCVVYSEVRGDYSITRLPNLPGA